MNKTLEERKAELEKELKESYKDKSRKWYWKNNANKYVTCGEESKTTRINYYDESVIIIKNEVEHYSLTIALSLIFALCTIIFYLNTRHWGLLIFTLIAIVVAIINFIDSRKDIVFIEINNVGIKLHKLDFFIQWEDVLTPYIKRDYSGETLTTSLVLHYYAKEEDSFLKTEYELPGFMHYYDDLSYFIEYWCIKTKNELHKTKEQPN